MFSQPLDGARLSSDHLLADISSNPVMEPPQPGQRERPRSLALYQASLQRVAALNLERALPSHGPAVLDVAAPGDNILITSFGSGAGSDSFVLKATDLLPERRERARTVRSMLDENKHYLTYGQYAAMREKIRMNDIV